MKLFFLPIALFLALTSSIAGASSVSTGYKNTCVINNSKLFCMGDNSHGQIGDGTYVTRTQPVQVKGLDKNMVSVAVATDGYSVCAVQKTSLGVPQLFCWGDNTYGQIGNGSTTDSPLPVPVNIYEPGVHTSDVVDLLVVTGFHVCLRDVYTLPGSSTLHHVLKCWGDNSSGQLGLGSFGGAYGSPQTVPGTTDVIHQIAAAYKSTCAVTQSPVNGVIANLYCWGLNDRGQLGTGDKSNKSSFGSPTIQNNSVYTAKNHYALGDVAMGGKHTCIPVRSFDTHNYGEHADNWLGLDSVRCWGANDFGQNGNGTSIDSLLPALVHNPATGTSGMDPGANWGVPTQVWAGATHTCIHTTYIDVPGTQVAGQPYVLPTAEGSVGLYCFGDGTYGQLGADLFTSSCLTSGPCAQRTPWRVFNDDSGHTSNTPTLKGVSLGTNGTCLLQQAYGSNGAYGPYCTGDNTGVGALGLYTLTYVYAIRTMQAPVGLSAWSLN